MTAQSDLAYRPQTCLPAWDVADLPEPAPLSWRDWTRFIGPGIVMMGIQIGGGEWLIGPEVTAKYGGGLMWIATVAIIVQVFYNIECGRYALYCGEPIFTGFMRLRPGPLFWTSFFIALSLGAIIPGLSTHAAAIIASFLLDRPPGEQDRNLVMMIAYIMLAVVFLPVLFGGKVYNTLQAIMTCKVVFVLGFTFVAGVLLVRPAHWLNVWSGFLKFGTVPVKDPADPGATVNAFTHFWNNGQWPSIELAKIAVLGAFAGYAGGGGLGNSLYSNFVRDKGWGMGSRVGAIPSAVGGQKIALSHLGSVFPVTDDNLRRWKGWWRYILTDQVLVWAPGCFVGMALPALLSLEFVPHSLVSEADRQWSQAVVSADGLRHLPGLGSVASRLLWLCMLFAGLMVLVPSQISVVDDVGRRWTDVIWSASGHVRRTMHGRQVGYIYYAILGTYVVWCLLAVYLVSLFGKPAVMTLIIPNLGNVAIGITAFMLLCVNCRFLPKPLRPRWYQRLGLCACGTFYLGLSTLVFLNDQWPPLRAWLRSLL